MNRHQSNLTFVSHPSFLRYQPCQISVNFIVSRLVPALLMQMKRLIAAMPTECLVEQVLLLIEWN